MGNKVKYLGWKKNPPHFLNPHSTCFWQKKIGEHYANVIAYPAYEEMEKSYSLEIQIEDSIIGTTININAFSYKTIDWKKFELDSIKIINALKNN